jgi:hypothetical protein
MRLRSNKGTLDQRLEGGSLMTKNQCHGRFVESFGPPTPCPKPT